jgi:two-component sensor histidine kinase
MLARAVVTGPVAPTVSLKLVEEINHRVANEYAEAVSTLSIAASHAPDGAAREALTRAAERLCDHAASHRALLPPETAGKADFAGHLARVCQAFTKATLAERNVSLLVQAAEVELPADHCWRICLVLVELIRNAARHGLRGGGGLVRVHVVERAGTLLCEVRDNGRPTVRSVPGHGQALVRSLVADLGGTVDWVFAATGAIARLQLPLHASSS